MLSLATLTNISDDPLLSYDKIENLECGKKPNKIVKKYATKVW